MKEIERQQTLAVVERERERATLYLPWNSLTRPHTLCLLEDKNLKILGFVSVAKKLYIKYRNIKEDMQLLHRQTVF